MKLLIDKKYNWESYSTKEIQCFFVGYFLYENNYYSKEEAISLLINKLQNSVNNNVLENFLMISQISIETDSFKSHPMQKTLVQVSRA